MYICICNAITDQKIRDFVENHRDMCRDKRVAHIYNEIAKTSPNCGKCLPEFEKVIKDKIAEIDKETATHPILKK